DLPEVAAMNAGGGHPLVGIPQIYAGAYDIGERAAEGGDAGGDLVKRVHGLAGHVPPADHFAGPAGRRRAGAEDTVAAAEGATVAGKWLPNAAGIHAQTARTTRDGDSLVEFRHLTQMMAEIAGGRQEGRAAILVAAVAGNMLCGSERLVDHG